MKRLDGKARWVRRQILEMAVSASGGHIASAYSCVEILTALYYGGLKVNPQNPKDDNRDRFILSKGHAVLALYPILADKGFFPLSELETFCRGRLGGHPDSTVPGIEVSTGALGHGLSIGAGIAFAARMNGKKYKTVVLLGDGECQEGSVWEAAMFAAHWELNLIAIVDRNRLQAIDFTEQVLALEPLAEKWRNFGWAVDIIDGHSFKAILDALADERRPLCIITHTVKGKGVSFMESQPIWHYRIPKGEELELARRLL